MKSLFIRLTSVGTLGEIPSSEIRLVKLVNFSSIVMVFVFTAYTIFNLTLAYVEKQSFQYTLAATNISMVLIQFGILFLNHKKKFFPARHMFLYSLLIFLFLFTNLLMPAQSLYNAGIIYFIIVVILGILFFDSQITQYIFMGFSLLLIFVPQYLFNRYDLFWGNYTAHVTTVFIVFYLLRFFKKEQGRARELVTVKNIMLKNYSDLMEDQKAQIILQKDKIAAQQKILEEKNIALEAKTIEIVDLYTDQTQSILYAKRIQKAILTPLEVISSIFPDHFIFYRPKDIISGDFYWIKKKESKVLVAVGDCTGHGVPGALMTMLSMSLLEEISDQNMKWNTDIILNKLRDKTIASLHQKTITDSKDGLDISICLFDLAQNKLEFSGAFNPILIYAGSTLELIKADKMPVGIYHPENVPFTRKIFDIRKGDIVYIFTDGFTDQFGGAENKKFMMKKFKDTLHANIEKPMHEQKQMLNETFEEWKGKCPQVDDVAVLGIKY